jgi:hypothetical protein
MRTEAVRTSEISVNFYKTTAQYLRRLSVILAAMRTRKFTHLPFSLFVLPILLKDTPKAAKFCLPKDNSISFFSSQLFLQVAAEWLSLLFHIRQLLPSRLRFLAEYAE